MDSRTRGACGCGQWNIKVGCVFVRHYLVCTLSVLVGVISAKEVRLLRLLRCDRFGIILMLLYSNKVPRLLGCNHYEDVVEMVGRRGKRIKVPEDAPEALGNIIRLCMEGDV